MEPEDYDSLTSSNNRLTNSKITLIRNLVAFWFLGLCNNYAYVIMLSAARDILSEEDTTDNKTVSDSLTPMFGNNTRDCNHMSTGAILLADILPALLIKVLAPFLPMYTHARVVIIILLSTISFLLPSLTRLQSLAFLGVVCASFSGGLGEVTFLSYSSRYNKNVVSTWSSGTGGSGVFGALSYAALTSSGVSPRKTLLIMLVVPVIMAISFWVVLVHGDNDVMVNQDFSYPVLSVKTRVRLLKYLLPFMIPLTLVFLAEYFINQGLYELLWFKDAWLSHAEQYRWYQVDYQMGVFISRSSVNLIQIKQTWIMPIIQFCILGVFLIQVFTSYMPSIWVAFALVFVEGLIGGCAYVNTFYRLSEEIPEDRKEFCMGVTTMSDSLGIAIAGGISLPVHNALCSLP